MLPDSFEYILLEKLKNDDQHAFEIIFTKYYNDLVHFSFGLTRNSELSEEIVQDVFLLLWETRKKIVIHNSLKSFLLKSVQNRSIDQLRHLKITSKYASLLLEHARLSENDIDKYILFSELEQKYSEALVKLPPTIAETFRMSRIEYLNYHEIANKLNVSIRTVEVRVSKALSFLREELKDYLITVLIFCQFFSLPFLS